MVSQTVACRTNFTTHITNILITVMYFIVFVNRRLIFKCSCTNFAQLVHDVEGYARWEGEKPAVKIKYNEKEEFRDNLEKDVPEGSSVDGEK